MMKETNTHFSLSRPGPGLIMKFIILLLILGTVQVSAAKNKRDTAKKTGTEMQQKQVTGKIVDSDGNALPGVNIIEKGTTNGAISDANGGFAMNVSSPNAVLAFSFIGFVTQEVTVGTQTSINITLHTLATALDEVVVVGYSTQVRKSLTGAISTVSAAELAESAATNPMTRLQGKVAGVTIMNQHTPGEGSTIRIRGVTTINNSNPLYVVDGVPGGSYSPNDVENITIMKDAAAQAIYGARAANGVVLITTKAGKKNQKVSMTVNVRQGFNKPPEYYDLLNTQEWADMLWIQAKNAGLPVGVPTDPKNYSHPQFGNGAEPVIPDYLYPAKTFEGNPLADMSLYDNLMAVRDGDDTYLITKTNKTGTDWYGEVTRNSPIKEYTMDIAGGSANTTYSFMLGYTKDEGIFEYTGFERYNGRVNISSSPAKWIDLGTTLGIVYSNDYGHQTDNGETSMISYSYRLPPMVPVYDASGTTYAGSRPSGMGNGNNTRFLLDKNQYDFWKQMNFSGTAFLKLNLLKGLSVKSLIGINQYSYLQEDLTFVEIAHSERQTYDGFAKNSGNGINWTWSNTLEYSLVAGSHTIKAIVGSEAYDNTSTSEAASRAEYPFLDPNYMTLNTGLRSIANSDGNSAYSLFSLFGRINYTFADKYLLEAVVRRDGSSRFGNDKYGVFPAFSLGWRVTEESFMASTSSWLNELKLRLGYGIVGNDQMGNYNSYTQFAYSEGNASYGMSGVNTTMSNVGFSQTTFGNPDVKWETTTTTNIGIDATLFKNLTVMFDVWQRNTDDMLYQKQLPLVLGTATRPSINIGSMKNTGFDFELGYGNSALNGDLTYGIDFNISHYKNEVTKLTDVEADFIQGGLNREKYYTRTQTGRAYPEFFGYIVDGIFETQAEADAYPKIFGGVNNKPGYFIYRDVDGNGLVDAADRTYIGSPHPDFTAGLSINLGYKGFSFSTTLYTVVGNEIANYVSRWIDYIQFECAKSHRRLYESWGSPYLNGDNSKATMPIILANDTYHQEPSTAFLEGGSFLRMKSLRIGYDFNKLLKNKVGTLQLYFQASNLFTIAGYSGLDPELAVSGMSMGVDAGAWPTTQQFLFGITLGI